MPSPATGVPCGRKLRVVPTSLMGSCLLGSSLARPCPRILATFMSQIPTASQLPVPVTHGNLWHFTAAKSSPVKGGVCSWGSGASGGPRASALFGLLAKVIDKKYATVDLSTLECPGLFRLVTSSFVHSFVFWLLILVVALLPRLRLGGRDLTPLPPRSHCPGTRSTSARHTLYCR